MRKNELVNAGTYRLLDRLRDLGNKARHVLQKVSIADADQGYAIVLRGLNWFFCEFPDGPKLKCLTVYNQPLDSLLPLNVASLLASTDKNSMPPLPPPPPSVTGAAAPAAPAPGASATQVAQAAH